MDSGTLQPKRHFISEDMTRTEEGPGRRGIRIWPRSSSSSRVCLLTVLFVGVLTKAINRQMDLHPCVAHGPWPRVFSFLFFLSRSAVRPPRPLSDNRHTPREGSSPMAKIARLHDDGKHEHEAQQEVRRLLCRSRGTESSVGLAAGFSGACIFFILFFWCGVICLGVGVVPICVGGRVGSSNAFYPFSHPTTPTSVCVDKRRVVAFGAVCRELSLTFQTWFLAQVMEIGNGCDWWFHPHSLSPLPLWGISPHFTKCHDSSLSLPFLPLDCHY